MATRRTSVTGPIDRTIRAADGFVAWCVELLYPLGVVRAKGMFGGHGLYVDACFVAIVADEVLYLKADSQSAPAFAAAGSAPFTYKGERQVGDDELLARAGRRDGVACRHATVGTAGSGGGDEGGDLQGFDVELIQHRQRAPWNTPPTVVTARGI